MILPIAKAPCRNLEGQAAGCGEEPVRSTLHTAIPLLSAIAVLFALVCAVDLRVDCGDLRSLLQRHGIDATTAKMLRIVVPRAYKIDATLEEDLKQRTIE